jgi:CDP-paratose 2-epimerase
MSRGERVCVFDDLSRQGSERNLAWLEDRYGSRHSWFRRGDVRDAAAVAEATREADRIVHLAGQVAVTDAVQDPRRDFEANALGTFNLLEGARASGRDPAFIYASTNKVYGDLAQVAVSEDETRYRFADLRHGVPETLRLAPISPYGCSKAAGDHYVLDYHRIYGLRSVVLRQSCIYGARQFGEESQGWVAWFAFAAVHGRTIRIFGDGKQVRDLLWIDDLIDVYDAAFKRIDDVQGEAFNVGGGPDRTLSVWHEFRPRLEAALGVELEATFHPWRPGEQKVYVSDVRKAERLLGWSPTVRLEDGIARLVDWARGLESERAGDAAT